jgi:putative PIN family toxin of toxin-antitoxin system
VRVVFDTNVIVAGIVAEGLCRELIEVDLPEHEAILSPVLWDELVGALRESFGLDAAELPVLQLYHRHATWVDPQPLESPVCRDPDDDWVLATAAAGHAALIVSGDEDLLVSGRFRDIAIVSPRGFLEQLAR